MTFPFVVRRFLFAMACLAMPWVAHASDAAPARIIARDVAAASTGEGARGERWVLRSDALGEDVALRIHFPVGGIESTTVLLVAMLPPADVGRIVEHLRQRERASEIHGVVVVALEPVAPRRGQPWTPRHREPIRATAPSRLTHFLAEELRPLLREELELSGDALVAGAGAPGRAVLQAAVEARGAFDEFVVVAPRTRDVRAAARASAGIRATSPASNINLLVSPDAADAIGPAAEQWIEGPFYLEVDIAPGEATDASDYVRDRAAQLAIVRPF